jgi:N6-adenosine-specific RNA methylase IME4
MPEPHATGTRAAKYRTIVADPPWRYEAFIPSRWAGRSWALPLPYPMMDIQEIESLPVRTLADQTGCRLFLWTTNRYLPSAFGVLNAWGFTYRQTIVWRKTGNLMRVGGSVAPNHAEYLLVATAGHIKRRCLLPSSVVDAPKGAAAGSHSRKPDVFLDLVEQVSPGPYLEMFARRQRLGWDTWGNEALEHVEVSA